MNKLIRTLARPLAYAALVGLIGFGITCIYPPSRAAAAPGDVRVTFGSVAQHDGLKVRARVVWVERRGPRDKIRKICVRAERTGKASTGTLTLNGTPIGTVPAYSGTGTLTAGNDWTGCWSGNGNTLTRGDRHTRVTVKHHPDASPGQVETYRSAVNVP